MRIAVAAVALTVGALLPPSAASARQGDLALLPPSAALARQGDLALRSVSAAHSATAGLPLAVETRVARRGRTRGAKLRFYLSAGGRRARLGGGGRVAGGSGGARVTARPKVPARQRLGSYRLIACVDDPGKVRERNERNNCRPAAGTLRVTAEPVGTRELVDAAVAAKRITPQQGLLYRVFAAFGDPRLPAAYAGDGAEPDHLAMLEAGAAWSSFTPAQQAQLRPLFTPPPARRSVRGAAASSQLACQTGGFGTRRWRSTALPKGHVRVWWSRAERRGKQAAGLVREIERAIWPRLRAVMGREPVSDAREKCFHGRDGRLDVYLAPLDEATAGIAIPYPSGSCGGGPSFVILNSASGAFPRALLAHELMHAFQFAFRRAGRCDDYVAANWDEAVATWSEQHVYPKDNTEHQYPWFMRDPEDALKDQSYEGWIFPYALEQLHGAGTIGAIHAARERLATLGAIDAGVPGGLEKAWPEFARLAWNQEPVDPTYRHWDRFMQLPERDYKPIPAEQIELGPSGQQEVDVPLELKPLSRTYRRFTFGSRVSQITVAKPAHPRLHVHALIKTQGGAWRTEDWSKQPPYARGICPPAAADRVVELVLVISNSALTLPSRPAKPLKVVASNLECARFTGSGSGSYRVGRAGGDQIEETWTANGLVFERNGTTWEGTGMAFLLTGGTVKWQLRATRGECTLTGGPLTIPVSGRAGRLFLNAWDGDRPVRHYELNTGSPLAVELSGSCPWGVTWKEPHYPRAFVSTYDPFPRPLTVPADGVLEGSGGHDVSGSPGARVSYQWRVVPDP